LSLVPTQSFGGMELAKKVSWQAKKRVVKVKKHKEELNWIKRKK
jgi:hypothetical protein